MKFARRLQHRPDVVVVTVANGNKSLHHAVRQPGSAFLVVGHGAAVRPGWHASSWTRAPPAMTTGWIEDGPSVSITFSCPASSGWSRNSIASTWESTAERVDVPLARHPGPRADANRPARPRPKKPHAFRPFELAAVPSDVVPQVRVGIPSCAQLAPFKSRNDRHGASRRTMTSEKSTGLAAGRALPRATAAPPK